MLVEQTVALAFIDSRKGSALPEFKLLAGRLSPGGVILCHDILNGGKGVEVHEFIRAHPDEYDFEIINTGPDGLIRIHNR